MEAAFVEFVFDMTLREYLLLMINGNCAFASDGLNAKAADAANVANSARRERDSEDEEMPLVVVLQLAPVLVLVFSSSVPSGIRMRMPLVFNLTLFDDPMLSTCRHFGDPFEH